MIKHNKNITSIFIVPTLGIDKETLREHGYVSGYIQDVNHDIDYKDVVFLLFRPPNIVSFKKFLEKQYKENKLIIEDYKQKENDVIIIYKLKEEFKTDYDLVLQGKYSETSVLYQKVFPEIVTINDVPRESLHYLIFTKSEKLAKYWEATLGSGQIRNENLELWPVFNLKNEVLNYETND